MVPTRPAVPRGAGHRPATAPPRGRPPSGRRTVGGCVDDGCRVRTAEVVWGIEGGVDEAPPRESGVSGRRQLEVERLGPHVEDRVDHPAVDDAAHGESLVTDVRLASTSARAAAVRRRRARPCRALRPWVVSGAVDGSDSGRHASAGGRGPFAAGSACSVTEMMSAPENAVDHRVVVRVGQHPPTPRQPGDEPGAPEGCLEVERRRDESDGRPSAGRRRWRRRAAGAAGRGHAAGSPDRPPRRAAPGRTAPDAPAGGTAATAAAAPRTRRPPRRGSAPAPRRSSSSRR